jgi:hypothetical protein
MKNDEGPEGFDKKTSKFGLDKSEIAQNQITAKLNYILVLCIDC